MKPWKLYIDDLRTPEDQTFIISRTVDEAKRLIEEMGIPSFISFDHDLGVDNQGDLLESGYDFAKWLVEIDLDGRYRIPKEFEFKVHSMNPVGAKNIQSYLEGYLSNRTIANDATLENLFRLTKEIIKEREEAYELLDPKHSLDEISKKDAFILSYKEKIESFRERVREYNFDYTVLLIIEDYKKGLWLDDEQLETLFMLIDGQRIKKDLP